MHPPKPTISPTISGPCPPPTTPHPLSNPSAVMCSSKSSPGSRTLISSTWLWSCVSALSNTTVSPVALAHKLSLFIVQDGVFPDHRCPLPHRRTQRPSSMLHHPQHALRTPGRRSPCPKISRTAGSRHRLSVRHPRFLLPNSESAVCGGKEGGRQPGCPPEFRLGRAGLPCRRRHLARASAIVRSFPSFPSRVLNVWWLAMTIPITSSPHRCPQLKSIGVGFGALLPSVRSHVRFPSTCLSRTNPTLPLVVAVRFQKPRKLLVTVRTRLLRQRLF